LLLHRRKTGPRRFPHGLQKLPRRPRSFLNLALVPRQYSLSFAAFKALCLNRTGAIHWILGQNSSGPHVRVFVSSRPRKEAPMEP
jgi:hypothetical protein